MSRRSFLTGATGFLGMEVLARLLERTDREVVALVRAADDAAAEARLDGVLDDALPRPAPYRGRVRALAGDLTTPGLGSDAGARAAERSTPSATARRRSRSTCRSRRRARSTSTARARCSSSRASGARALRALRARLDRVRRRARTRASSARTLDAGQRVPQHLRADQVRGRAARAPTPTTCRRRSRGRASSWASPTRAGRRRSTSSTGRCGRSRAGCSTQVPAQPDGRVDVVPVDYVADGIVHADRVRGDGHVQPRRGPRRADGRRADRRWPAPHFDRPRPPYVEPGRLGTAHRRRARRRLPAVLRHGRRVRRLARPRAARARRDPRPAPGRATSTPDRLRRGRPLGQAPMSRQAARERLGAAA